MKTTLLLALVSGLCAQAAFGQENATDLIILNKVKANADASNAAVRAARQHDDSSSSASDATATPVNAPPPAARPNSREEAVAKLKADIALVRSKGTATKEMKAEFAQDLLGGALGSTQPSMASLTKFSDTLLGHVGFDDHAEQPWAFDRPDGGNRR
jgi:hypothetical protein